MWVRFPPWSLGAVGRRQSWGRRPTGRRPPRTREIGVQFPAGPLNETGSRADASCVLHTRRQGSTPCGSTDDERVGSWSRRYDAGMACRQPGFNSRRVHSVDGRSGPSGADSEHRSGRLGFVPCPAASERPSASYGVGDGYGWPCRVANSVAVRHKGSNPFPSAECFGGETDIIPRFERGVSGSNPDRSTDD